MRTRETNISYFLKKKSVDFASSRKAKKRRNNQEKEKVLYCAEARKEKKRPLVKGGGTLISLPREGLITRKTGG